MRRLPACVRSALSIVGAVLSTRAGIRTIW